MLEMTEMKTPATKDANWEEYIKERYRKTDINTMTNRLA
jgi:hypothetical protein